MRGLDNQSGAQQAAADLRSGVGVHESKRAWPLRAHFAARFLVFVVAAGSGATYLLEVAG
jgi:hypothetical protein